MINTRTIVTKNKSLKRFPSSPFVKRIDTASLRNRRREKGKIKKEIRHGCRAKKFAVGLLRASVPNGNLLVVNSCVWGMGYPVFLFRGSEQCAPYSTSEYKMQSLAKGIPIVEGLCGRIVPHALVLQV